MTQVSIIDTASVMSRYPELVGSEGVIVESPQHPNTWCVVVVVVVVRPLGGESRRRPPATERPAENVDEPRDPRRPLLTRPNGGTTRRARRWNQTT